MPMTRPNCGAAAGFARHSARQPRDPFAVSLLVSHTKARHGSLLPRRSPVVVRGLEDPPPFNTWDARFRRAVPVHGQEEDDGGAREGACTVFACCPPDDVMTRGPDARATSGGRPLLVNPDVLCRICMNAPGDRILRTCNHAAFCSDCMQQWDVLKVGCPVCRVPVHSVEKIFLQ